VIFPLSLRAFVPVFLFALGAASPLCAYIDHLTEAEVDEAYLLGQRHDQDLIRFLRDYETSFGTLTPGTHVRRIAVRTPYCSVVLRSFEKGSTYGMVASREEYAADPDPFQIVVSVDAPSPVQLVVKDVSDPKGQFWKQFNVSVSQDGSPTPRKITAVPIYGYSGSVTVLTGGELRFEYDVRQIGSKLLQIRVTGPGPQDVKAEFDLDALK